MALKFRVCGFRVSRVWVFLRVLRVQVQVFGFGRRVKGLLGIGFVFGPLQLPEN